MGYHLNPLLDIVEVKARSLSSLEWVHGWLWPGSSYYYIIPYNYGVSVDTKNDQNVLSSAVIQVIPDTISLATGKLDDLGNMLYTGDVVSAYIGHKKEFEVLFEGTGFGIKALDGVGTFTPFSSITDSVSFHLVRSIHDSVGADTLEQCTTDEAAKILLQDLKDKLSEHTSQKYLDAIDRALHSLSKSDNK